jgi:Domain of unknown function (DUF4389)
MFDYFDEELLAGGLSMTDAGVPTPAPGPSAYPVVLEFERDGEVARWRPLVNWLLAIPQFVVYLLVIVERALSILSFFFVLFTKKIPDPIFNFRVMAYRYQWRVTTFAFFMSDEYPPFSFELILVGFDPSALMTVGWKQHDEGIPVAVLDSASRLAASGSVAPDPGSADLAETVRRPVRARRPHAVCRPTRSTPPQI